MDDSSTNGDELDSTFIIAIVIGSTGFVLMVLGGVYYLSRLGDVPSRKAVASAADNDETEASKDGAKQKTPVAEEGDSSSASRVREELIEIYAPAGRLGVVLEESSREGGPPTVHQVRDTSVLKNELLVGDRIIAIDDEDVRKMSANKVSKIISRKMENPQRKLSIIRTIAPEV